MLAIENLVVDYGKARALHGVSLTVRQGEVVALIGRNGAGKTTLLRAVTGLVPATAGKVTVAGTMATGLKPNRITALGVAHVPQGRQVFADQSVADNLRLGAYLVYRDSKRVQQNLEREYRRFPRLRERKEQMAGTLSGGEQQMLAISRALMSDPKLVVMDEPSMGLAPVIVMDVLKAIKEINQSGTTVLLVEQLAAAALSIADRGYVLQNGQIQLEDTGKKLLQNPDLIRSYLG
ncbi:MAG TPA: ABC transporter ATP-binding protein [Symbiobacteriaceae bacterium]|jgi:branched-chain amino acid transport system ATP-binding protein